MKQGHKARVEKWLPLVLVVVCAAQPVLDAAGYWQNILGMSNVITFSIRIIILAATGLAGFLLSERKGLYFAAAGLIALVFCGHIFACIRNGGFPSTTDISGWVRILAFPVTTICMITFVRNCTGAYEAMRKGIALAFLIIVLIMLIATLTGTDHHTYATSKTGVLGWFMWPNTQSAILSISAPVAISWALKRWKKELLPVFVVTAVSLGCLYVFGTRLAYASMAAAGLGVGITLWASDRGRRKQACVIIGLTAIFIALYPVSPMTNNLDRIADRTEEKIARVDAMLDKYSVSDELLRAIDRGEAEVTDDVRKSLENIYVGYVPGMMDHFGVDRTIAEYHYTADVTVLSNVRQQKIMFCEMLMEDAGLPSKLFGLDVEKMHVERMLHLNTTIGKWEIGEGYYDVENDTWGMYFLGGIAGFVLSMLFLFYFGFRILANLLRNWKKYFNNEIGALGVAYCCAVVHIIFTASLLRRNNGSFYLSVVIAMLMAITDPIFPLKKKEVPESAQMAEREQII